MCEEYSRRWDLTVTEIVLKLDDMSEVRDLQYWLESLLTEK
jgi:hypothetical protein